jgi:hypothetical protein
LFTVEKLAGSLEWPRATLCRLGSPEWRTEQTFTILTCHRDHSFSPVQRVRAVKGQILS